MRHVSRGLISYVRTQLLFMGLRAFHFTKRKKKKRRNTINNIIYDYLVVSHQVQNKARSNLWSLLYFSFFLLYLFIYLFASFSGLILNGSRSKDLVQSDREIQIQGKNFLLHGMGDRFLFSCSFLSSFD